MLVESVQIIPSLFNKKFPGLLAEVIHFFGQYENPVHL